MIEELKKYSTISFCFDGILYDDMDGEINSLKEPMQEICKELIKNGKNVYAFSRRHEGNKYNECQIVYEICKKLNINTVLTSRNNFCNYLSNDTRHCHVDISDYEILLINTYKPDIKTMNFKNYEF